MSRFVAVANLYPVWSRQHSRRKPVNLDTAACPSDAEPDRGVPARSFTSVVRHHQMKELAVVDDMDVTRSMSEVAQSRWLAEQPLLYTVEEAAGILRIGRTLAYDLVQRFQTSGGREGLPAVRVGHCWRVPREVVLQIALGVRTVGTAGRSAAVPGEEPRAARAPRVRVAGSGGSQRAGPSEQLFLLPPSD
jgi:Helix-turn-helix domain